MALILKDRVKETTIVTSTGTATLLGAVTGYQAFSVIGTGNTCYYTIAAQTGNQWEVGIGTFTSPDQLSRDTVLDSSNSGSLVNFSAGTKDVFITQPAEKSVYTDATNIVNTSGNGANVVTFTQVNTTNLVATTVTLTAGTISTNAANATDIVNKQYVDGIVAAGVHYHTPVLVESPTALNAVYVQPGGAGNGIGATLTNNGSNVALVIDGISVSNTARVLVYTQANAVQNGVYTVTNEGAPDTPGPGSKWVLTRATDADTYVIDSPTGLSEGSTFFVQSGNTGAGETYTCNTTGTITFGTTDITFAQISSAQIYSAGTGLSLTNTTFSLVTPVATTNGGTGLTSFTANAIPYASNSSVLATGSALTFDGTNLSTTGQVISTKTGSPTDGTGQVYLNGATSNRIEWAATGTGAPAFTTRSAGTKTLLYPAISGSQVDYAIGIDSATLWSSVPVNSASFFFKWYGGETLAASLDGAGAFTATSFTGNGVALTAINASNVTSGTLDNARTTGNTANSASTIVLRDASGNFGSNVITASLFSGDGAGINAINASNISAGTISNARTTAASANGASTIVSRDSGGNFSANTITANISGDISGGTNINASNISSGTIGNAFTTANSSNGSSTIVLRDAGGAFAAGAITATSLSGNGSAITAINASAITTGTLDNARTNATSANGAATLVVRDSDGSFAGNVITGTTGTFTSVSGNGVALTAINASNIASGTVATARLASGTANASTFLRGDQTWSTVGVTITDDTSTNATYYPVFTSATSGTISTANVSSTELTFNPGTNVLTAPNMQASNGIFANNRTVGLSYVIPSGYSAVSTGPVTLANGVSVTVPSGGKWVVL
jgi:uncharacterized protein (DUF779 family)